MEEYVVTQIAYDQKNGDVELTTLLRIVNAETEEEAITKFLGATYKDEFFRKMKPLAFSRSNIDIL